MVVVDSQYLLVPVSVPENDERHILQAPTSRRSALLALLSPKSLVMLFLLSLVLSAAWMSSL